MSENKEYKNILEQLETNSAGQLSDFIKKVHPADLLDAIRDSENKELIFKELPDELIAEVIDYADNEEKYELLKYLPEHVQNRILNEVSSDELADMLGSISDLEAENVLIKINKEDREEIKELSEYEPETAGGIMATEFISVVEEMTVQETLEYLQREAPHSESPYYIYVLDKQDKLKGVVTLRDIVKSNFNTKIKEIMSGNVISVNHFTDQEEVGHIFEKYGFLTLPVVNEDNEMLGIVTVDDILQIITAEDTEDIYRLAGVVESEKISGSIRESVSGRLPWLFINLITAFLAAATVGLFQASIQKVVALATFLPIVAGMGGNTGTQSLTVIVRSIALGELTEENAKWALIKELSIGVITGLAIGATVSVVGYVWQRNYIFGIVIGLAMLLNMVAATISGFLVPVVLKKLNIDPALASTVFVTTVTDVLGFFFFLGLATIFITRL